MAEPADAKPDTTVQTAAALGVDPEGDATKVEAARRSYHAQGPGTDPGGVGLGRKDPETTGQNARDDHGVQTR